MKGAGKENISSNKTGQPNPRKDKNIEVILHQYLLISTQVEDLTAKLATLEKEKRELVTKKVELELNKNKEIAVMKYYLY